MCVCVSSPFVVSFPTTLKLVVIKYVWQNVWVRQMQAVLCITERCTDAFMHFVHGPQDKVMSIGLGTFEDTNFQIIGVSVLEAMIGK